MIRVPFAALVAGVTAAAALIASAIAPGRLDVIGGAALGTAVAGLSTVIGLALLRKAGRGSDGDTAARAEAAARLVRTFSGLMLARMIGYLAFLGGVVVLRTGDPVSVCIGLAGGTVVFQTSEILYLRKLT
jgi:hypothetical protein